MVARSRKGAFCVRTVGGHRELARRQHERLVVELGERVQVAQLFLGIGRREEPLAHLPVGVGVAGGGHHRGGGGGEFGVDGGRVGAGRVEPLATACLHADVGAEHADEPDQQPAQLAGEVGFAVDGVAERSERR